MEQARVPTCLSPAVIMVIDDVPANLRLLGEILRSCGYQVQPFTDGAQALAAAAGSPPDLVLLDISMPGLDGYSVCERLKADERLARVPVLFISALGETTDKVRAFQAGGVDYLTKPFEVEEVLARVDTHLRLRRALDDMERQNLELRELEATRDSLVHMIVHDLRNPLASAAGFLRLLEEDEGERLSGQGRGYVHQVVRCTDFLMEMINGVLDVSRMEAGRMQLGLEACDLVVLAGEVVSRLESLKGSRRLAIEAPAGPVVVRGDRQLVSRVIQNLVGNALKSTPQEGGAVVLGIDPGASAVRVTVRDNGQGIPSEHLGKVFEKFWQGEARKQGLGSTGLGLTFAKMVVEAHGGAIGVTSEVGRGSAFWFELPAEGPPGGGTACPPRPR